MKSYDNVYKLADEIKNSETFAQYKEARDKAFESELNKDLYKKYKEIELKVNAYLMANKEPDEELKKEYQQITSVLSLNSDISAFMIAEHRLNQMMGDIFRILAKAVDIDLGFLND